MCAARFRPRHRAGVSSFMWRKNSTAGEDFRVYAPDLLGLRLLDKPRPRPTRQTIRELLADFIRRSQAPGTNRRPPLSAAYDVRLADEHPELVDSLILIAQTERTICLAPRHDGRSLLRALHRPSRHILLQRHGFRAQHTRLRAQALYFDRPRHRPDVANYYATSHQPAPQHAIAAFLRLSHTDTRAASSACNTRHHRWGKQIRPPPSNRLQNYYSDQPQRHPQSFDRCRMMPHEGTPKIQHPRPRRAPERSAAA